MSGADVTHTATGTVGATPGEVFDVVSDLTLLPSWWFSDSAADASDRFLPNARAVRGSRLRAETGVMVDVVSTGAMAVLFGRARTCEDHSVVAFECTEVRPGALVRLEHRPTVGVYTEPKRSTELVLKPAGPGTDVTLTQVLRVDGFGLGKTLQRAAVRRSSFATEKTLDRLLALIR